MHTCNVARILHAEGFNFLGPRLLAQDRLQIGRLEGNLWDSSSLQGLISAVDLSTRYPLLLAYECDDMRL